MPQDDGEVLLHELLSDALAVSSARFVNHEAPVPTEDSEKSKKQAETYTQWALGGNDQFIAVGSTVKQVPAGIYQPFSIPGACGLEKLFISSDGIYTLPDMATETVLSEAQTFWDSEAKYRQHHLLFKRGIILSMLHPGGVKTRGGGPRAALTVADSIKGMRGVIDRLGAHETGQFYNYAGMPLPW